MSKDIVTQQLRLGTVGPTSQETGGGLRDLSRPPPFSPGLFETGTIVPIRFGEAQ
jgi:hypothetical protein